MMTLERLGKYQITEVLGKGAMGIVYKAFDPNIRRTVAIKTIRKELIDDDRSHTMLARFKNEAQAAGRLSHPGIVAVFEYGEEGDLAYIAMEYVQGNSLREYFNRNTRFEDRDVVSITAQLLEALAYAHEQGVYHRDIKPANLIIMTSGKLKIADFGIARIDSSNLTQIGAIMGTPGYMAPEQYAGSDVDWRADLFSSGVVLYQLLTGVKPFTGSTESIAYKVCYEDSPPPSQLDPERVSSRYDEVVARAMAKKREDRFQNALKFRAALLDAYAAPVAATVSEETIITEIIPTTIRIEPTHPSQGPSEATPTAARTTEPPAGWDLDLLRQIEGHYARFVGPVAKVLVRRLGRRTINVDELYALLAENLSANDGKGFLATRTLLRGTPASKPGTTRAEQGTTHASRISAPLTPEAIDAAQQKLASYLGPIARVIVKKAATQAKTSRQFYMLLADHLVSTAERERFLAEVGVV
jgi:eukaryotic-like serine/threonine-protein kinase